MLALVLLGLWAFLSGGEVLLDYLPEGYWFAFHGGPYGETPDGRRVVIPENTLVLDTAHPEHYRIPKRIQDCNPDTVRTALRGRRVKAMPVPEDFNFWKWSREKNIKDYFLFRFQDETGALISLYIVENGDIFLEGPGETLAFRDSGGCFKAMRHRFGTLSDIDSWRKPEK